MKRIHVFLGIAVLLTSGCLTDQNNQNIDMSENPFYAEYQTTYGAPPFDAIKNEHYLPAISEGIKQKQEEVLKIANNADTPTFENTLTALEKSGGLLDKVTNVFYNLSSALTNDEIQAISKEISPMMAKLQDDIRLNENLFQRIKTLYEQRDELELNAEQNKLLEKYYKDFVRGGANLSDDKKDEMRKINKELSLLSLQFGENVLKETNRFEMYLDNKSDLAGLPDGAVVAAESAAKANGKEGKWLFTLHKPSLIPFLQYSTQRDLREKMFKGYIQRGDHNDELDNKDIMVKMANLRVQKALLLGYETHAHFVLEQSMAGTPDNVYELLNKLWIPALALAKKEREQMQKMIDAEGENFSLEAWDWWYYAEKVKKANYDFDQEQLRPYFELENVRIGAFFVAEKLFGITFEKRTDIPLYHPDVEAFEVKEANGNSIGLLLTDYFPRESKRGGAWMSAYREQENMDGHFTKPIIVNVGNFTKPTDDKPALLSLDEALTLFHEFGHGLHGLLSNCTYPTLSGTSVSRDFVELPSQIMENWLLEPEVMEVYAKHYKSGEAIPVELVEKIKKIGHFNQGFITVEYLAASFLDMDWHTLKAPFAGDAMEFEQKALNSIGLIPEIVSRYRSPFFQHIFAGGYSSGYYSYIWAETLDSDAFNYFKETNIFDKAKADSFRSNILSRGGTADPMELYRQFRGADPGIEALLVKRGLN